MRILFTLFSLFLASISFGQTCNKLNHNCSNTVNLNTSGVTSNGGTTYACSLGNNVLYSSSSGDPYIATDDIDIDQGMAATLHFDAKRASGYFGTGEVWVHVGGYCNFQVYNVPFNDNGWVQIGTFSPNTTCSNFGPYTVPSDVIGGQQISFCIVLKNASSTNFVSIDNICVSQISGSAVPTTMNEDFGTSSSGWYPNTGVDDVPYHTYKNASDAYTILGTGADGFPDKAAYFYTGFDFCSTVSGVGIVTKEVNTSGYTNGEIRLEFKSKYPCSGSNSYTFDENYQSYSPEVFVMTGADHGSNTWNQLPVNYYFADYNWRVASYDISAYKNANVRFKIERGGFCGTSMEAVDNIKILDRDCSISLLSCGTITGESAPLQNTNYAYTVPAVTGATYYKWYVRQDGNLYDTAPYIVSGQGTQNVTINFQTLPSSGVRVLCIPFDTDPGIDTDACYAQIGYLGVTVSASNPFVLDGISTVDVDDCAGDCDGSITINVSGGQTPYIYSIDGGISFFPTNLFIGLCAGDYDVVAEDDNGDAVSQTVTISEPPALVYTIPPTLSMCEGDTTQILASATGGTPPYMYNWTPTSTLVDPNVADPLAFPPVPGETYTGTVTDVNGCITAGICDITTLVAPNPEISASITSGCAPFGATFDPIPASGPLCIWDFGDGNADTLCSTVFNLYTTPGTYDVTLTATLSNGCVTDTTYIDLITVLTTPTLDAGNDTTICDGDQITLTAFNPDAAAISWDNGVSDGVAFAPTMDTIYVVSADLSGCQSTDTIEVLIDPAPSVDLGADITSCDPFVTLDAGAGMDAYLWSNTQTTQTIDATTSGTYWVTVTEGNCESTDTIEVTLLDCSGFIELNGVEVKLFPNPTDGIVMIEGLPIGSSYIISSVEGKILYEGVWDDSNSEIDLTQFERGTYMLYFEFEGSSDVIRIMKQ